MNYHTLSDLHLPHNETGNRIVVHFDADDRSVDVEFVDGNSTIGHLHWQCGASAEPLCRCFARRYIEVCRQIPPYCARDIRTLFEAVCFVVDSD